MSFLIPSAHLKIKTPANLQLRAKAVLELRKRGLEGVSPFAKYQFDPEKYTIEKLGWKPWRGKGIDEPGQVEIMEAAVVAVRQQLEREKYEHGEQYDETIWKPGQVIQNYIRVEAGHGVGKTKGMSALVSWFLDCFRPSIIYTFAPSWKQVRKLLWKEIKKDRKKNNLPGRILETCEVIIDDDHFASGHATDDSNGSGTERVQGQHGEYLMFVLDEAEGIPEFVFEAIDSMASGGIVLVLMIANPKTRNSPFYRQGKYKHVLSMRMNCINHPNVVEGKSVVRGAVKRGYVDMMLEKHCEEVAGPDDDQFHFQVPWIEGKWFKPDNKFMFRVLGIPPANASINTIIPVGRYEAAIARGKLPKTGRTSDFFKARIGVDVARWGDDFGAVYMRHDGRAWRVAHIEKQDTYAYVEQIKAAAMKLPAEVWSLHIRLDGTGGFASGVVDRLKIDPDLRRRFKDYQVIEVNFGSNPSGDNREKYGDKVTEMYVETAEVLKDLAIEQHGESLSIDLTDRQYKYRAKGRLEVKVLEEKDQFRERNKHSPDDGDGFVLCAAPDFCFTNVVKGGTKQMNWMNHGDND